MLNDCSIDRILAIDNNWSIIAWNKTAELISGITKEEVVGKHLLDVFPRYAQDSDMMQAIQLAFSGVKSFLPAQRDRFNRHHYENHFIPLNDPEANIVGVMNIMHDVSHRIKAEQELYKLNIALKKKYEELERTSDELSTITYITSHNIKEPLRAVYSSIELLIRAEAKVLSDGGKANLRRMQASLNRMNLLLDDIVAISAIHYPQEEAEPVTPGEVLQAALTSLSEKIKSNNVLVEAGELPQMIGYRDLLYYLFFHLISNAMRFRKHGQPLRLSVSSRLVAYPASEESVSPERCYVKISFVDDGTGFSPEDAERIFLMADKTPHKYASSGAGLAICRKIMVLHEGFIEAEGWPGQGAAFHCYFPAAC